MYTKIVKLTLLLIVVCVSLIAHATETDRSPVNSTGAITGTVKDVTGSVLQGAQIVVQTTTIREIGRAHV